MSVPSAFLAIHGVLFEDRVEHVCAVDLAGEVAVVACVVAADEMASRMSVCLNVLLLLGLKQTYPNVACP